MSRKRSNLTRRRSTRTRQKIAGKLIAGVEDRPDWLPEDWAMELKKRGRSPTKRKRVDRYYICPLSGKRLRSRVEVMHFLNSKLLDHSALQSASCDVCFKQLPIVEIKGSQVKRTMERRHSVVGKETISNAITEIQVVYTLQEQILSSLAHASEQLDNGASETSCSTTKNVEKSEQCQSQIEVEPYLAFHVEQPAVRVLTESEDDILTVPDAGFSEEKQLERTQKQSQPKRHNKCGSSNADSKPSLPKRKAEKGESVPIRTSKRLAGVTAEPVSNFEIEKRLRSPKVREIEQAEPIVPEEAHQEDVSITVEEKVDCLNPFAEASKEQPADVPRPAVPKDTDESCLSNVEEKVDCLGPFAEASKEQRADMLQTAVPKDTDERCLSHQKDLHKTAEVEEKLERVEPLVEQASQEQQRNDPLANTLPFGDSWSDPCIEFAFKTLTGDFPVFEDVAAIQDYLNHQHISSESLNLGVGQSRSAFDGPSFFFRDNDRLRPLENGKADLSNPVSKNTV